jgi:guanylate kinase
VAAPTPTRGRLVVVAAPSGAGKTTLVRALLARRFAEMVERDELLEHARVFDHWYGTGRRHVEALLSSGRDVLLEIDWQGARQVRERAPDALTVFILPPSIQELERRLRGRGTDAPEVVERRLRDALGDMSHWREFDYVIVNDDLQRAAGALAEIVAGRGASSRSDRPETRAAVERVLGR